MPTSTVVRASTGGMSRPGLVGIFAAGRNGSTLLMRLLDGSPGLWIYPIELNYLRTFAPHSPRGSLKRAMWSCLSLLAGSHQAVRQRRIRRFHRWVGEQLEEMKATYLDKLVEPIEVRDNPLEDIGKRTQGTLTENLPSYLDGIRRNYDDRQLPSDPLLMFKSLEVMDLPRYEHLFPEMKFVHIVRHPYTNYACLKRTDMVLKQKPFWDHGGEGDILRLQLESRWIPHAEFALQGLATDSARHHLVRYEDLCRSPQETVTRICTWLGVDPPVEPALQTVLGGKHLKILPRMSSLKGVDTPAHVVPDMAAAYGYEDILTERERALILLRTYEMGRRLGYFGAEDATLLPNRWRLFAQWIPPDEWEYKNTRSKAQLVGALIQRRLYLCRKLLLSNT
jgi:hypothetical protein